MTSNGYNNDNTMLNGVTLLDPKSTYAVEHLATFRMKLEAETKRPKDKLKTLIELEKACGIWPMKMYMCFSGQWLIMLDSVMNKIEIFPGALIAEPTAFISADPMEIFNNILIFTVPSILLGKSEMHVFQMNDVCAVHIVKDIRNISSSRMITIDRKKTSIKSFKADKTIQVSKDHYDIVSARAKMASEKMFQDKEKINQDINVINHCFEDIEQFIVRLKDVLEALHELEVRKTEHSSHGERLLSTRCCPPTKGEFKDILAKHKFTFNYIAKLKTHFLDPSEPLHNSFVSLQTIVNVCNNVYVSAKIVENIVKPWFRRDTIIFFNKHLNEKESKFLKMLGPNWTQSKDQLKDHIDHIDDWSPDWLIDKNKKISYIPTSLGLDSNVTCISRLQSANVKVASNESEWNFTKGEHHKINNDSRNWWKACNTAENIGYVPHTILYPTNCDKHFVYAAQDIYSLNSSVLENDNNQKAKNRNSLTTYIPPSEHEVALQQTSPNRTSLPRSYSMPNVPIPPPMPPPSDLNTSSGIFKWKNAITGKILNTHVCTNYETDDEALILKNTINDELKITLMQREKRKDLEILKTPQIYINQHSSSKEVGQWLRRKGFSEIIVKKLSGLNGDELFALPSYIIEEYFGRKESRRLISQIVLQKNICEYKTIRLAELSAKLAKARQKVDNQGFGPNSVF